MILNLTAHAPSAEQVEDGVVDLPVEAKSVLRTLTLIKGVLSGEEITERANQVVEMVMPLLASTGDTVMLGGHPALTAATHIAFLSNGVGVCYAASERASKEVVQEDGSVHKVAVFRHIGFTRFAAVSYN